MNMDAKPMEYPTAKLKLGTEEAKVTFSDSSFAHVYLDGLRLHFPNSIVRGQAFCRLTEENGVVIAAPMIVGAVLSPFSPVTTSISDEDKKLVGDLAAKALNEWASTNPEAVGILAAAQQASLFNKILFAEKTIGDLSDEIGLLRAEIERHRAAPHEFMGAAESSHPDACAICDGRRCDHSQKRGVDAIA
jgi:hypothetical protein